MTVSFQKFAYLYNDYSEYKKAISTILNNKKRPKYIENEREKFLNNNSWQARAKTIFEEIEKVEH